jgi:uncharacterized protein YqkB
LFAKEATGSIGVVTIQNCIAFRNGYTEDGRGYGDCDGNGFKLGGSGVGSAHVVKNCLAFENLHCGFTDNNNPKLESLTDCTAFNNDVGGDGKPNFSLYRCTDDGCDFSVIISYLNADAVKKNNDKFVGTMQNSVYYNGGKYYNVTDKIDIDNGDKTGTIVSLSDSDFVSVTAPAMGTDFDSVWRESDGTINVNGFMQLISTSAYSDSSTKLSGNYDGLTFAVAGSNGNTTVTPDVTDTTTVTTTVTTSEKPADTTSAGITTTASAVSSSAEEVSTVTDDNGEVVTTTITSGTTTAPIDTTTVSTAVTGDGGLKAGDSNCDGNVRVNDIQLVRKILLHALDAFDSDSTAFKNSDVTGDGTLRVNDIQRVRQYVLHIIDSLE